MSMAEALAMVDKFQNRAGKGAFANLGIERRDFGLALRDRVRGPNKIYQGDSSLCGPAAFLYNLATKNPMAYAGYVIDLYDKGSAWIGKLKVEPGRDCKAARPEGIAAVDWVALASLRDSANAMLDYDSSSDQVAGITGPGTIAEWFRRSGYFHAIVKDTNVVIDRGLSTLLAAHAHRASGGCACLLIGANILIGESGGSLLADHWVVLTSELRIDGQPVVSLLGRGKSVDDDQVLLAKSLSFQVFTWGDTVTLPTMSVAKFLDYFYGYVGAK